ncbi:MAG: 50S ribosomal protein L33 [Myxococcota bacterium]
MREIIQIVSSAGTGYRYYTTKNKRTTPDKLKLKKYDPIAKKHVEFVEKKMPSPKK